MPGFGYNVRDAHNSSHAVPAQPQLDMWGRNQQTMIGGQTMQNKDSPDVAYGKVRINKLAELMGYYNSQETGGRGTQIAMGNPILEKMLQRSEARTAEKNALANAPQYFDQQPSQQFQPQAYQPPSYTSGQQMPQQMQQNDMGDNINNYLRKLMQGGDSGFNRSNMVTQGTRG